MNCRSAFKRLSIAFFLLAPSCPGWANDKTPGLTILERQTPHWLTKAVFYQIYPQSFYDTNGDGIGDLPGITAKLDYIQSLGVNAIWINPFYDSPFGDAGYDVRDFKKVAPRYGTNDDARQLFIEAHRRGFHVILDLVAGHTSIENAWFKDSCQGDNSVHANWYVWGPDDAGASFVKSPGPRPGKYLKNFFPFQPALNYGFGNLDPSKPWERRPDDPDCIAVREAMRDVMKYWLDLGCDGFRADMASSLVKNDGGTALKALWQDYRSWMNANYPQAVLISEWSEPDQAIPAGFDVDFLIHFGNPAYTYLMNPVRGKPIQNHSFFSVDGSGDIQQFLKQYLSLYEKTRTLGFMAIPTGNHDFSRPRFQGREIPDVKVMYTMLLTMPGVPFIYYGDEIGMRNLPGWPGKEGAMWRGSCRSPMQWAPGPQAGFSTADPKQFYLPLDPDPVRPDVADEEKDPNSLLNFTRALLKLRAGNASLGNLGHFKPLFAESHKYPFVYLRSGGPDQFLIAINPSHSIQSCALPAMNAATPVIDSGTVLSGATLTMQPVSYAIYKVAGTN